MPECLISGVVTDLDGDVAADAQLTFTRIGDGVFVADGEVRRPNNVFVQADPNGVVSFSLLPGNYRGVMFTNRGARSFRIGVPEQATAAFADLVGAAVAVNAPSAVQTGYPTRAAFVAANAGTVGIGFADGIVVSAAGFEYRRLSGATSIADLPGWVPNGLVYPEHFGAARNGITDDAAAINAALTYSRSVYLAEGNYAVGSTISLVSRALFGSSHLVGTQIIGLSSMPVSSPIIALGSRGTIEQVIVGYSSGAITGSEVQDERVAIFLNAGGIWSQRVQGIRNVRVTLAGTAIGSGTENPFSFGIEGLEVQNYSFAAVDIRGTQRTANDWGGIHISSDDTYNPSYGVRLVGQESGGTIARLNIEHAQFKEAPLYVSGSHGLQIGTLTIEGADLTQQNKGYVTLDQSVVRIGSANILNTRMTQDNSSVFRLLDAGYTTKAETSGALSSVKSSLDIGVYHVKNIASPSTTTHPTYPAGRVGVDKVAGFRHFCRPSTYTDRDWSVSVKDYEFRVPSTGADATRIYYQYPDTLYSDATRMDFVEFTRRGAKIQPGRNFLTNPDFATWTGSPPYSYIQNTNTDTETATGWFIDRASGEVRASRQEEGYGPNARTFLRFSNVGTSGTFQNLYTVVSVDWRSLLDAPLMLSFEMRASVAGQRFSQISITFRNTAGTPTSLFKSASGTGFYIGQIPTDWQVFHVPFSAFSSSDISVLGTSQDFLLQFQVTSGTAGLESQFDICRPKLEVGTEASSFSVGKVF